MTSGSKGNLKVQSSVERVERTKALLVEQYLADSRPWVIAYSGGKDSTLVLQLVYEILKTTIDERNRRRVYVVSSDTRVEAPNVVRYVEQTLDAIDAQAVADRIPLETKLVRPEVSETFWAKLIGRGYPPPTRWFRWCTTSMKIKPSRRAIDEITREHGSVILLLGTRLDESSNRRNRMTTQEVNTRNLNPHHEIPNALVLTPISDWSTDEVWEYLYSTPPPWPGDHSFMLNLYRQASGGECPVVLDLNTPSCGGSRFGCWTCTVVKEDKSMKGFVESGVQNMEPLLVFRDWLKDIRERPEYRSNVRRDSSVGPGPFTPEARKEILDRLLATERQTGFPLISSEEIEYIQQEWSKEFDYSESANKIANTRGRGMSKAPDENNQEDEELLEKVAAANQISPELARQLLATAKQGYATLDVWGGKKSFQRELAEIVEKAVKQARQATPDDDL